MPKSASGSANSEGAPNFLGRGVLSARREGTLRLRSGQALEARALQGIPSGAKAQCFSCRVVAGVETPASLLLKPDAPAVKQIGPEKRPCRQRTISVHAESASGSADGEGTPNFLGTGVLSAGREGTLRLRSGQALEARALQGIPQGLKPNVFLVVSLRGLKPPPPSC
jgi:hypothetical protein